MILDNYNGTIEVNGVETTNLSNLDTSKPIHIVLYPNNIKPLNGANSKGTTDVVDDWGEVRIRVRAYMTKPSTPEFDLMAKFNKDIPMPLRVMTGTKEKETEKMVYMKLHGDLYADVIHTCMKCGRVITNPVSRFFGLGPECGGHNYTHPFASDDELKSAVEDYKKTLLNMTWEGWIPKSAIEERVSV